MGTRKSSSSPIPSRPETESFDDWTRRKFLGVACLAGGAMLTGCATNPATGKRQFMLVSEDREIQIDRIASPHQFSADYGALLDPSLQTYIGGVGKSVAGKSHRPHMPFTFHALHASYVNAYIFPGGSVGITRGILLAMESEAALAALIGHEVAHVTARHSASRMSKGVLAQIMVVGLGVVAAAQDERYAPLVTGLGGIGAGLLLARYSRENEREADKLGMQYMVAAGYNPSGMVELMDVLQSLNKRKPLAIEQMFASHPMSDERYATAQRRLQSSFARDEIGRPTHRDRYMDMTAGLRAKKNLIEAVQDGDREMMRRNWAQAQARYQDALKNDERDYEALLKMARCRMEQEQPADARRHALRAREAYPAEPHSYHVGGLAALRSRSYDHAARDFDVYLQRLPGNPMTVYYSGRAYEGLGNRAKAVERYQAFLNQMQQGEEVEYARKRLIEWKVVEPDPPPARQPSKA